MQAESIIIQAKNAGVELSLSGDRIAARPKIKLNANLRELIKANRQEVVRYLSHSELVRMAIESGSANHDCRLHKEEVSALIPPADFRDIPKCEPEELQAWADALAMRAVRYRGLVPVGWDQVANCQHCGPVYSFAAGNALACPWCEIRRASKTFPQPKKDA